MSTPDPETFAREQSATWSSVAPAWNSWWSVLDKAAQHLNERLVELAGVCPGQRVLDVACGLGEPSLTAARRAGPTGRVLGVDLAAEMISFARRRAADAGLEIDFQQANAEELELEDHSFDAAVSRWGLMLMLRPELAAGHIQRALRPGARFATSVWGPEESGPFLYLPRQILVSELDAPAADPKAPGPFRYRDENELKQMLETAGFKDVKLETMTVAPVFDNGEAFCNYMRDMSSALGKLLAQYTPEQAQHYWEALRTAAEGYARNDGKVQLDSSVHVVVATA